MSEEEAKLREDLSSILSNMPIEHRGEIEFISGAPGEIEIDTGQSLANTAATRV